MFKTGLDEEILYYHFIRAGSNDDQHNVSIHTWTVFIVDAYQAFSAFAYFWSLGWLAAGDQTVLHRVHFLGNEVHEVDQRHVGALDLDVQGDGFGFWNLANKL